MASLRDLIHKVEDPDLKDQMLRRLEREGYEAPLSLQIPQISPPGVTVSDIHSAVLNLPGVQTAAVSSVGKPPRIHVTVYVLWGHSRVEVANAVAKVLHEIMPAGVATRGGTEISLEDGSLVRFTLVDTFEDGSVG